jgi:hypothetical protein
MLRQRHIDRIGPHAALFANLLPLSLLNHGFPRFISEFHALRPVTGVDRKGVSVAALYDAGGRSDAVLPGGQSLKCCFSYLRQLHIELRLQFQAATASRAAAAFCFEVVGGTCGMRGGGKDGAATLTGDALTVDEVERVQI